MDFGSILYAAQKNEKTANKETKCYKTKFEPPKKEIKSSSNLSVNIQNYLKKRDQEERRKADDEKRKKEELLALRSQDRKSFKRVQTMLKRTKSANKSVMEDAIDDVNTAVTMAGPQQCDEDDYGYVSQEASAFYAKLMDKYSSMPPEEPKFPQGRKAVAKDLNAAKDRVRAALQKEEEEEMMPHKRKRKSKSDGNEDMNDDLRTDVYEKQREPSPETIKPKKLKKSAPPPMDFSSLLKLAEQKQFEPVAIEKKVTEEDNGRRPMTKKEKMEYERERERRERQMERERARKLSHRQPDHQNKIPRISEENTSKDKPNGVLGRIPKKITTISNNNNEGLKRNDSVDSDSPNRYYSVNERVKSYNNSTINSSQNNSQPNDKFRNKYQVKDDYDNKISERNTKPIYNKQGHDLKFSKREHCSVSSNKINSRRHDISDEEMSDQEDGKSSSHNNTYDKQRQDKSSFPKLHSSKCNEDFDQTNPERNGYKKRQYNNSEDDQSDSQPGNDSNSYKQRHSSSIVHKQKPEVKYKSIEKKNRFSDVDSYEKKLNSCSDIHYQSDSQSVNNNDNYKQKYSSTANNRQKPEVKYKPTEKKHQLSDRDSFNKRRYSNSDNELSDSQSGNDSDSYKHGHSKTVRNRQNPEMKYKATEKKHKFYNKDAYDKGHYNNSNNDHDSQSGNDSDSYKHGLSKTVRNRQNPEMKYKATEKKHKLSDKDTCDKSHYNNSNNESDSQSGNDSDGYKPSHSKTVRNRQNPEVKYKATEKKHNLSDKDTYYKSHYNNSDNEYDSQSGNDSDRYKHGHSKTVRNRQNPEEKYKATEKKHKLPDRESYRRTQYHNSDNDLSDNYEERSRSRSPVNSYSDRHSKSYSDSEAEQEKKYVPSKKENVSKKEYNREMITESSRKDNRSSSPDDDRFCKIRKNHKTSTNDSEHPERKKCEVTKKSGLNKGTKISNLFKESNEKDLYLEKNHGRKVLELKSPKPPLESDRCRNPGTESKFKIPKSSSQLEFNRTKLSEFTEKSKSSELKNPSKSQVSNDRSIKRDLSASSYKTDSRDRDAKRESSVSSSKPNISQKPVIDKVQNTTNRIKSNSKPDIENQRVSLDKNKPKSYTSSSNNRLGIPSEDHKKQTLKAEEVLKKNANVWSKPCNLSSPKPTPSGLSESQLQRLREMNKKPTPSRPTENPSISGQGRPSLLKAAAAHAAARAAAQKAQTGNREAQKELIDRQSPLKSGDKRPALKPTSTSVQNKSRENIGPASRMSQRPSSETQPKQFPPSDLKPKQFPPNDLKPRNFPPKDVRPRQFPPADVKKRPKPRRIQDDSEEDEYDSEMDDFIDDGTDMNQEQISKEIQSIFGYDKSRYAGVDDEDDECMESNFGQIDREEYISLRIGAKEDYDELMKDLAEKERKKKMKKQTMKQR